MNEIELERENEGILSSKLFELIATTAAAATDLFAAKKFFTNSKEPNGIKFWLGSNFEKYFLSCEGKTELDVPQAALNVHKLRKGSVDGPIISELGGESQAETSLAYMAELIKKQPKGEEGILLTNGYGNIFYLRDCNNQLWAVCCYWYSDGREWDVEACSVTSRSDWDAGYQLFSRGSL